MSNYTKTTNFTAKDALASGDPDKLIVGAELDSEYDAIATAIATKANSADVPTLTGANTFTSTQIISNTQPVLRFEETDQGSDAKLWSVFVDVSSFIISTRTDANGAGTQAISIARTGTTVTDMTVRAAVILTATNPSLYWYETDAGADEKRWRAYADGGQLLFQTRSDDNTTSATWLNVFRSGTTVTDINFSTQSMLLTASTELTLAALTTISAVTPRLRLYDSNAGSNAKYTEFNGNSGFALNLLDDSGLNPTTPLAIARTGTTADSITLTATATVFSARIKQTPVTVASLPSASTSGAGARYFVSDANATTFASIVAGGGANNVPVYSDGTNWRIG